MRLKHLGASIVFDWRYGMSKLNDLTGKRFERLVVIGRAGSNKGNATWLCKCDCENMIVVEGRYLTNRYTKSCGCINAENIEKVRSSTEYKKLEGFDFDYFITKDGKIWASNKLHGDGGFMRQCDFKGYKTVGLYKDGKQITCRVHRLVAQTFIPNPENKPYINHIDGNRANNHVDNLEWCTQKENVYHAIHTLGKCSNTVKQRVAASKVCTKKRKLSMEEAREVRHLHWNKGYSLTELSEMFNLSRTGIKRILNGRQYKEEGTKWQRMIAEYEEGEL